MNSGTPRLDRVLASAEPMGSSILLMRFQHCGKQHLHRYAAEFDFRYNHRIANGVDRGAIVLRAAAGKRLRYQGPDRESAH